MPGGETRTATLFKPCPTYVDAAQGSYLRDVDGNQLLDLTNNSTTLIHGHAHPTIVHAIQNQIGAGTAWNAPNSKQIHLAELLCERIPSLDRIRFCASGTEANMHAIKAARAFTGRDLIMKMDGAYHGTYEGVEVNAGGQSTGTKAFPVSRGMPLNTPDNVLIAPFDDTNAAHRIVTEHGQNLAAVVITPVQTQGTLTKPSAGYLESLRELTQRCGALLIFDEVITLRLSWGGGQDYFGLSPDLTAMGKIIGGGLPVGAFGGRADVINLFVDRAPPAIPHAGTFNGNPATMVAGIATI